MPQGRSQSMTVWSYPEETFCPQVIPSSSIRAFLASLCKTSGGRRTQSQAAESHRCLTGSSLATPPFLPQCINEAWHFTLSNDWSPMKISPGIFLWNLRLLKQIHGCLFQLCNNLVQEISLLCSSPSSSRWNGNKLLFFRWWRQP